GLYARVAEPRGHLVTEAGKLIVEDAALDPRPHDRIGRAVPKPRVRVGQRLGQLCRQIIDVSAGRQLEPGVGDLLPVGHGLTPYRSGGRCRASLNDRVHTVTTVPVTQGYAPVNGVDMYWESRGEGGVPLVVAHGGYGLTSMFGGLLDELAAERRVIA